MELIRYWIGGHGFIYHYNGDELVKQDYPGTDGTNTGVVMKIAGLDNKRLWAIVNNTTLGLTTDPNKGARLLKTIDGGTTWENTGLELPDDQHQIADFQVLSDTLIYLLSLRSTLGYYHIFAWSGTSRSDAIGEYIADGAYTLHINSSTSGLFLSTTTNAKQYRLPSYGQTGTAMAISGFSSIGPQTNIFGNNDNLFCIEHPYDPDAHKFNRVAMHDGSNWTNIPTTDTGFRTGTITAATGQKLATVDINGNVFVCTRNSVAELFQVGRYKDNAWLYYSLGAGIADSSGAIASTGKSGLAAYKESNTKIVLYLYDRIDWTKLSNSITVTESQHPMTVWGLGSGGTGDGGGSASGYYSSTASGGGSSASIKAVGSPSGTRGVDLTGISFEAGIRRGRKRIGPDRQIG